MVDVNSLKHFEAQQGVLGSIIIDSRAAGIVMSQAREDDFTGTYRTIFNAIRELFISNTPIDPVTINHKLGGAYDKTLLDLMQETPTAANVEAYLRILKEQSLICKANELGQALGEAASVDEARTLIDNASKLFLDRPSYKSLNATELLNLFYNRMDVKPEYLEFGISKLDENLYAEAGDFIVIGGRPSAGKTALAIQMANEMSKTKRVGFFSFETGEEKFSDRIVCQAYQLDMGKIKQRSYVNEDYSRISNNANQFCSKNIEFLHANGMTVAEVQSIALAKRLDIVFVDYLQIVNPGISSPFVPDQVRAISIGLHNLAQHNGIVVIALSQLRKPSTNEGVPKQPSMADLRESGQIEQDADIVMMLSLTEPSKRSSPRLLHVVKNKEGECGKFILDFEGATQTFCPEGVFHESDTEDLIPEQFTLD